MQVKYLGHSSFYVEVNETKIIFDPFIRPNSLAKDIDFENLKADFIFVSHGHEDHIADLIDLAKNTKAKVVCNWEIHAWLQRNGISNTHPMNIGGEWTFNFGKIKMVTALHTSSFPDGTYAGNPVGFLFDTNDKKFYYAGDTGLTLDMKLIPLWLKLDYAFLPIGNNFTMNVKDAILCSDFIECNNIIGMHYDTFGYIVIDHSASVTAFTNSNKNLYLLDIGEEKSF